MHQKIPNVDAKLDFLIVRYYYSKLHVMSNANVKSGCANMGTSCCCYYYCYYNNNNNNYYYYYYYPPD